MRPLPIRGRLHQSVFVERDEFGLRPLPIRGRLHQFIPVKLHLYRLRPLPIRGRLHRQKNHISGQSSLRPLPIKDIEKHVPINWCMLLFHGKKRWAYAMNSNRSFAFCYLHIAVLGFCFTIAGYDIKISYALDHLTIKT